MSEKPVVIYVTSEFRAKIKTLKKELTYEKFLDDLIKKNGLSSPQLKPNAKNTAADKNGSSLS